MEEKDLFRSYEHFLQEMLGEIVKHLDYDLYKEMFIYDHQLNMPEIQFLSEIIHMYLDTYEFKLHFQIREREKNE